MLLAAAYRAGGELALFTFNGWVALASFAAAAALTMLLAPRGPRWAAAATGLAAVALLATSPEQWVRLAVPLADGAAQLFTTLAVALTLLAVRLEQSGGGAKQTFAYFRRPLRATASRGRFARQTISSPGQSLARDTKKVTSLALLGGLTGLALSTAYSVRYTQALVAPGLLLAALWALKDKRQRWAFGLALAKPHRLTTGKKP